MFKRSTLFKLINFWPPYLGAGIRIKHISDDIMSIDVEMKLRRWNRNYVKTHFGGSLYAMTDPFFMLILMEQLGRDYIVWDKAATIRFKKPGVKTVFAHFEISPERLQEIRDAADSSYKVEPTFTVNIVDKDGTVIAEVDKLLYVRRRD
ncbi:MAG: YiiD C-terminal domain-containing protein [Candidatus Paracaedibacteraceae bacterium]|nr:YiiD C-terminal domain-containing protein [Candidatus Paracaedibacteraceae bacterium]